MAFDNTKMVRAEFKGWGDTACAAHEWHYKAPLPVQSPRKESCHCHKCERSLIGETQRACSSSVFLMIMRLLRNLVEYVCGHRSGWTNRPMGSLPFLTTLLDTMSFLHDCHGITFGAHKVRRVIEREKAWCDCGVLTMYCQMFIWELGPCMFQASAVVENNIIWKKLLSKNL